MYKQTALENEPNQILKYCTVKMYETVLVDLFITSIFCNIRKKCLDNAFG